MNRRKEFETHSRFDTLQAPSRSSSNGSHHSRRAAAGMTLDELRAVNRYAESTKSLSYLPQVRLVTISYKVGL